MLDPKQTAIVLIGYQNDYFAAGGILNPALEDKAQVAQALVNTIELLDELFLTPVTFIAAPIIFTPLYEELINPVGILKTIKDVGAFKAGTTGAEVIDEMKRFGDRILYVPGKRGLNAFSNTELHSVLQERGIRNVVFAGIITSLCIDSSARQAADRGYGTYVLTDCTAGRTSIEQNFYCKEVFPLYANVLTKDALLQALKQNGVKSG